MPEANTPAEDPSRGSPAAARGGGAPIYAFVHIVKTAGRMVEYLLRRYFGPSHVDVRLWRWVKAYSPEHLRQDLRLYPWARSIAGHRVAPHVDFEELDERLVWYTFLREPVARYVSHFAFRIEVMGDVWESFDKWLDYEAAHNVQVKHLAGGADLDRAKEMVTHRLGFVGLQSEFDRSMLMLSDTFGWHGFNVSYKRQVNASGGRKGSVRSTLMERFDTYRDRVIAANSLDIELHDYVKNEIWPRQVERYGADRLERDMKTRYGEGGSTMKDRLRHASCMAYRFAVYKPWLWLETRRRRPKTPTS